LVHGRTSFCDRRSLSLCGDDRHGGLHRSV
jgi:hypothetical protein